MKILALDISSHTGWAILENDKLISYGKIDVPCKDSSWPLGVINWVKDTSDKVFQLIASTECDKIIIERANSSRFRQSQNYLDWLHFDLINIAIENGYYSKLYYMDTIQWRRLAGIKMTKEQLKQNKEVSKLKKTKQILKINGKRQGKLTKKHLAVFKCNELFGTEFLLKDNDQAEACLLGHAFFVEQKII